MLSGAESVWEAVWNTEGRCSGMNVSRYFTFLASTYNLFNANVSLLVVMWWVSFWRLRWPWWRWWLSHGSASVVLFLWEWALQSFVPAKPLAGWLLAGRLARALGGGPSGVVVLDHRQISVHTSTPRHCSILPPLPLPLSPLLAPLWSCFYPCLQAGPSSVPPAHPPPSGPSPSNPLQVPLGRDPRFALPSVDRDQVLDALKEEWGVKPWVACDPGWVR